MIDQIEAKLGLEEGSIAKIQGGETIEGFSLDNWSIMPKSDFDTIQTNYQSELETAKTSGQQESQKVGQEMLIKDWMKENELEYDGRKDFSKFIPALKAKILADANLNVDERIAGKDNDISSLKTTLEELQANLLAKDEEMNNIHSTYKAEKDQTVIREAVGIEAAKFDKNSHYKAQDLIPLFLMKNKVGVDEGVIKTFDANGDVIKNNVRDPKSISDSFEEFMKDGGYLKKVTGGSGGGDELTGNKKVSIDKFTQAANDRGESTFGAAFGESLQKAIKDGIVDPNME